MTSLEVAVARKQWQVVAYRLLLGISEAAHKLPPASIDELIDLLMPASDARQAQRGN